MQLLRLFVQYGGTYNDILFSYNEYFFNSTTRVSFAFCLFRFELEQSASFWRGVNFYLFTLRLYAKDKQGREEGGEKPSKF